MLKQILQVGVAMSIACLAAEELPDLSKFERLGVSTGPVFFEDFNSGMKDWSRYDPTTPETNPDDPAIRFVWCAREGMMGSGCVMGERKQANEDVEIQRSVELKHGILYRLRVHYRSEMVPDPDRKGQEIFGVRFRDSQTGRLSHGSYMARREDSRPGWTEWVHHFRVPEGYDAKVVIGLLIRSERIGKVWFDDIVIEEAESLGCTLFPVGNDAMTYDPEAGITWFVNFPAGFPKSEYKLLAEVGGLKKLLDLDGSHAHGVFGEFPEGRLTVKASLLDMTNKKIVGTDDSVLFVRKVEDIPGRIVMGKDGRMIRDGKPFLPVGVYLGWHDRKDTQTLRRIKDAGFNCVEMVWRWVDLGGQKDTIMETVVSGVREMAKYDLGFLCAIKYQLPSSPGRSEKIDNIRGLDNVTRSVINAVKREPNMIGYYISDENPVTEVPAIRHLRELAGELDPWHPTMTLTCRVDDFTAFASTGDYLMFDDYPVGCAWHGYKESERQTMAPSHKGIRKAKKAGVPFVWVPQIFCWYNHDATWPRRYPTAKEIRSMALLGAVYEAKAYFFYSYQHVFYLEKIDPAKAEETWANAAVGAKLITSLAPWFLSTEPAPEANVRQISGAEVAARAFVHEGKPLVIITADGPDECEAEITIPGVTGLKSRYGNTEEIAPGVYKFKGLNIDSDVLELN